MLFKLEIEAVHALNQGLPLNLLVYLVNKINLEFYDKVLGKKLQCNVYLPNLFQKVLFNWNWRKNILKIDI